MPKASVFSLAFGLLLSALSVVANAQDEVIAEAVVEASEVKTEEVADATPQPSARPITVSVSLVDESTTITGTLTETTSLTIKTAFGLADLPLSEVAGVRFPRGDDTATTVVMLNGDSITGATDLKFINVETSWGNAKVNGQSITSMLMVPGLAWQSVDVLGAKRWQLIEAPRNAAQNSAPALPSLGSGSSSTRPGLPSSSSSPAPTFPSSQPVRINN